MEFECHLIQSVHELVGLAFQFEDTKDYLVGVKDKKGVFKKLLVQKVLW